MLGRMDDIAYRFDRTLHTRGSVDYQLKALSTLERPAERFSPSTVEQKPFHLHRSRGGTRCTAAAASRGLIDTGKNI
jgi:hypothetical protein